MDRLGQNQLLVFTSTMKKLKYFKKPYTDFSANNVFKSATMMVVFVTISVVSPKSWSHIQFDDRWQISKDESINELHVGLTPNYEPLEGESSAPQALWKFDFQFGHFQSRTNGADRGYDVGFSFETRTTDNWIFGAGMGFSHTNLEKVTKTEPKATLGYYFPLSSKSDSEFEPSIEVKLNVSNLSYKQGVDPQTGSTTSANADYRFSTRGVGLDLGFSLVDWVSVNVTYFKYSSEAELSNRLSSLNGGFPVARARRSWAESLAQIVSEYKTVAADFVLSPKLDLNVSYSQAVTYVEKNVSHDLCVELDKDVTDKFRAGVGLGGTRSDSGSNSYGIIFLGYKI